MNLTRLISTVSLQGIRVPPSLTRILPHETVTHVSGPICYPCLRSIPPPLPPPPLPPSPGEEGEQQEPSFRGGRGCPSPGEVGREGAGEGSGVRVREGGYNPPRGSPALVRSAGFFALGVGGCPSALAVHARRRQRSRDAADAGAPLQR